jgi:hypothetical protein
VPIRLDWSCLPPRCGCAPDSPPMRTTQNSRAGSRCGVRFGFCSLLRPVAQAKEAAVRSPSLARLAAAEPSFRQTVAFACALRTPVPWLRTSVPVTTDPSAQINTPSTAPTTTCVRRGRAPPHTQRGPDLCHRWSRAVLERRAIRGALHPLYARSGDVLSVGWAEAFGQPMGGPCMLASLQTSTCRAMLALV